MVRGLLAPAFLILFSRQLLTSSAAQRLQGVSTHSILMVARVERNTCVLTPFVNRRSDA